SHDKHRHRSPLPQIRFHGSFSKVLTVAPAAPHDASSLPHQTNAAQAPSAARKRRYAKIASGQKKLLKCPANFARLVARKWPKKVPECASKRQPRTKDEMRAASLNTRHHRAAHE